MPYYGYGYGYGGYGLAYSWTYLLVLAGVIVCLIAVYILKKKNIL